MTEKNMSGKINELLETLKDDEKRQTFLNDFEEFLNNYHQPSFAVGEYYTDEEANFIFKVLEIRDGNIKVLELNTYLNNFKEGAFNLGSTFAKECKPATAEQIATFKRAEHFASKGRKLDEFHVGDLIEKDGELNILGNISMEEYGDVEVDGCKLTLGKLAGRYNLIQTAEELQEVGE